MTSTVANTSFLATRRGKLTLALLCAVAFLDFVDAPIVNVALPSIRHALHFSVAGLQWVPSAYLLTYGGFMLLGGRLADLLGRRRILLGGIVVIGLLVADRRLRAELERARRRTARAGARRRDDAPCRALDPHDELQGGQGPAHRARRLGRHRRTCVGGRRAPRRSPDPGIRLAVGDVRQPDRGRARVRRRRPSDPPPTAPARSSRTSTRSARLLATGGMLLLVYTLVKAPTVGWGARRTIGELAGAVALLVAFVINELRHRNPLAPLSIFKINGLAYADVTQLIAFAGFLAMFFFLTLYMQNVLHYSPIQTGIAYLPVCFAIGGAAGAASQLLARVGTRPVIVAGALIAAGGIYWLSRIPVGGSYVSDLLPGMVIMSLGVGPMFVGVTTAANSGVPADKAGLAAALVNASQQVGGALGLAIFTALATSHTKHLLAAHVAPVHALNSGLQRGLLASAIFLLASAFVALRATNTRGEEPQPAIQATPEPALT